MNQSLQCVGRPRIVDRISSSENKEEKDNAFEEIDDSEDRLAQKNIDYQTMKLCRLGTYIHVFHLHIFYSCSDYHHCAIASFKKLPQTRELLYFR